MPLASLTTKRRKRCHGFGDRLFDDQTQETRTIQRALSNGAGLVAVASAVLELRAKVPLSSFSFLGARHFPGRRMSAKLDAFGAENDSLSMYKKAAISPSKGSCRVNKTDFGSVWRHFYGL